MAGLRSIIVAAICAGATLMAMLSACQNSTRPTEAQSWSADITATRQVLFMTLTIKASSVSGTGTLSSLLSPGTADALTLVGTRHADTLDITFSRTSGDRFRLIGHYVGSGVGLTGSLTGGEFSNTSISFRSR